MIINDGLEPCETALNLKGIALCTIVRSDDKLDFNGKLKIYKKLVKFNKTEYAKYRLKPGPIAANSELTSIIALYHKIDPIQMVDRFESMLANEVIDYQMGDNKSTIVALFSTFDRAILLRYVIGFKLNEFDLTGNDGLYVVVGKGKHSNKGGINNNYSIKQFVIDQLEKFNPPIMCKETTNNGMLFIPKDELFPYLNTNNENDNDAIYKLRNPSNDWYVDDPRQPVISLVSHIQS